VGVGKIAYSNFVSGGPGGSGGGRRRAAVPLGNVTEIGTSDMFQSYKEDFLRIEGQIDLRVSQASGSRQGKDIESNDASALNQMLREADSAVKQMEFEAKTLPNRDTLLRQVEDYRGRLGAMKRKCNPIIHGAEDMRSALLGNRNPTQALSQDNRNRLMQTTTTLHDGVNRLEDARRQALETEDIGLGVMQDLQQQRETIQRTQGHVRDVGGNLNTSAKLLTDMARRAMTNRLILWAIIVILVLCNIMTIYLRLTSR